MLPRSILAAAVIAAPLAASASVIDSYSIYSGIFKFEPGGRTEFSGQPQPSGFSDSSYSETLEIADYLSGSGALNNGGTSLDLSTANVFSSADDASIVLSLDAVYRLKEIIIYYAEDDANVTTTLSAVEATASSASGSASVAAVASTSITAAGLAVSVISATGTDLEDAVADTITLSGFETAGIDSDLFAIAEIEVVGTEVVPAVPLPASGLLLVGGVAGLGLARHLRRG
ncbi:VPLPA-CTERM sorting domain-containing protein [Poseidonocella sp. HB161398]|uniref:VPLPA-CTERM sorting domain-containing protein n=1 Tax=Poseidonocella sp. HB161398 TaxID=2320855 RepID=UPI001109326F|nr:VPLPA-CTERM sorting domain-containing protein [Poseidonocella sp. HB161398]